MEFLNRKQCATVVPGCRFPRLTIDAVLSSPMSNSAGRCWTTRVGGACRTGERGFPGAPQSRPDAELGRCSGSGARKQATRRKRHTAHHAMNKVMVLGGSSLRAADNEWTDPFERPGPRQSSNLASVAPQLGTSRALRTGVS